MAKLAVRPADEIAVPPASAHGRHRPNTNVKEHTTMTVPSKWNEWRRPRPSAAHPRERSEIVPRMGVANASASCPASNTNPASAPVKFCVRSRKMSRYENQHAAGEGVGSPAGQQHRGAAATSRSKGSTLLAESHSATNDSSEDRQQQPSVLTLPRNADPLAVRRGIDPRRDAPAQASFCHVPIANPPTSKRFSFPTPRGGNHAALADFFGELLAQSGVSTDGRSASISGVDGAAIRARRKAGARVTRRVRYRDASRARGLFLFFYALLLHQHSLSLCLARGVQPEPAHA